MSTFSGIYVEIEIPVITGTFPCSFFVAVIGNRLCLLALGRLNKVEADPL
jgi:hypothetical protein